MALAAELDDAVGLRGGNMGGAEEDEAVALPRGIVARAVHGVHAAAEDDAPASIDVAAEADLVSGGDGDGGVTAEAVDRDAERETVGVAVDDDVAAGGEDGVHHRILAGDDGDLAVGRVGGNVGRAGELHADAVHDVGAADDVDPVEGLEPAADLHGHVIDVHRAAADPGLAGGRDINTGRLGAPRDDVVDARAAGENTAHELEVAVGYDADERATVVGSEAGRDESAVARHDDAKAVVARPRRTAADLDALGGDDGGINDELSARADGNGGVGTGPGDVGGGDLAAGEDEAAHHDILAAADGDVGAGALGDEAGGRVNPEAQAIGVGARAHAGGAHAAEEAEVAGDIGGAFPVNPLVGLDGEVGVGAEQIEGAADDGVLAASDAHGAVVLQRRQGAGEEEAEAAVAVERVDLAQLERLEDAVAAGVVAIDHVFLGPVGYDPAVVGQHATQTDAGVAVVDAYGEGGAEGLRGGGGVIDGAVIGAVAELGGDDALLLGGEIGEGGVVRRSLDVAPVDPGVAVVGGLALDEAGDDALLGAPSLRVEINRAINAAVAEVRGHAVLLRGGEAGVSRAGGGRPRPTPVDHVVAVIHDGEPLLESGADAVGGVAGVVVIIPVRRLVVSVAEVGADAELLRLGEALEGGVGGGRASRAPIHVGVGVFGNHALDPARAQAAELVGGLRVGIVIERAGNRGVAKGLGHAGLLREGEVGEGGVGGGGPHPAPVNVGVAVIEHGGLEEAGHEPLPGGSAGVVVGDAVDDGVAEGVGDDGLLRVGEVVEARVVAGGGDGDRAAEGDVGAAEEGEQLGVERTGGERREGGGRDAGGGDLAGEDEVEVIGVVEERIAGLHHEVARRADRAGEHELAAGEDIDGGVDAGLDRHGRAAGVVKLGAGGHGGADVEVQEGGRGERDDAVVAAGGDEAAVEHGKAGAGGKSGRGVESEDLDGGGDLDGAGGIHRDEAVVRGRGDGAARVGGEAVGAVAVADHRPDAGGALDVNGDGIHGAHPAADQDLLGGGDGDDGRGEAGIGRAERVVDVGAVDLNQARVDGDGNGVVHVADNVDPGGPERGGVAQQAAEGGGSGRELQEPGGAEHRHAVGVHVQAEIVGVGAVLEVAEIHRGAGGGPVADAHRGEAVGERIHIAQGEVERAVGTAAGEVVAEGVRAGGANLVGEGVAGAAEREGAGAAHGAATGVELHVVGHQGDAAATGSGADEAGAVREEGVGGGELDVNGAVRRVEAVGAVALAGDLQAVRLADDDVGVGARAGVDDGEGVHLRLERARDARAVERKPGARGGEAGGADVEQATGLDGEIDRAPRGGRGGGAGEGGRRGGVGDLDQFDRVVKADVERTVREAVVGEHEALRGGDGEIDPVVAHAAVDRHLAGGGLQLHHIVAGAKLQRGIAGMDGGQIFAAAEIHGGGPGVEGEGVVAVPEVRGDRAGVEDEGVAAVPRGRVDGAGVDGEEVVAAAEIRGDGAAVDRDRVRAQAGLQIDGAAGDHHVIGAVVGENGVRAGGAVDDDVVVAGAAIDEVGAGLDGESIVAAAEADGVVAKEVGDHFAPAAALEVVLAQTHVEGVGPGARGFAGDREDAVVAGAQHEGAAGRAAAENEQVVAVAHVELEIGAHVVIHLDHVVTVAAVGHDMTDVVEGHLLAERLDGDRVGAVVAEDMVALVGDIVVEVLARFVAQIAERPHVEIDRVADLVGDDGRITPAPTDGAGEADAHDGDGEAHVGVDFVEFDEGLDGGEGDVDGEQAKIDGEVHGTIHAAVEAPAAVAVGGELHIQAGVELENPEVETEIQPAIDLEIPVGADLAADGDGDEVEEVQLTADGHREETADDAHVAVEIYAEGDEVQRAVEADVEGVGGDAGVG